MEGIKKTSQVLSAIACELIDKDPNDRMEPFLSLAQRLGVSNGTVQNAVHQMQRDGALLLTSRGHLGSFIAALDRQKLLEYIGISSVYWAMPIPYSKRYEGFASGLRVALDELGLNRSGTMFLSGAQCRVNALLEHRADGVLMSSLALRHFQEAGVPIEMLHKFPDGSYVNNHFLITRQNYDLANAKTVRVGVDPMSYDQSAWNKICFAGKNVIPIPVGYLHVLDHIRSGVIDAAVWSFEDQYFDKALSAVALHNRMMDENTAAVLAIRRDDPGMLRYLRRYMNFDRILQIQRAVMDGTLLPDY